MPWRKLVHKVFIMVTTFVNRTKRPVTYEWHPPFNVKQGASWWFLWEHSRVPEDKRHYLWTHKCKYNFIWVVFLGTARACTICLAWIVAKMCSAGGLHIFGAQHTKLRIFIKTEKRFNNTQNNIMLTVLLFLSFLNLSIKIDFWQIQNNTLAQI